MSRCARWCAAVLAAMVIVGAGVFPAAAEYANLVFPGGREARTGVAVGRHLELLYDAGYASRAADYLNGMADAVKNCDRAAYDRNKQNLQELIQIAEETLQNIQRTLRGEYGSVWHNLWYHTYRTRSGEI